MSKCLFSFIFLFCASAASAQSAPAAESSDIVVADLRIPDTAIVVVAEGVAAQQSDEPFPITAIGDAELRSIQGPDLTRALARLPGVTTTRNGGLGGFTGVRVRGAGAEQLLVLVDGVKVNDPSAPGGGFDFGNLTGEEIGKVELLRGAHSVVWGSDALAGVMNLTTRRTEGVGASAEYGGAEVVSGQVSTGFARGGFAAGLSGGYVRTRGISAAANGVEPDGFEQWHLAGRASADVSDTWRVVANGRYARGEVQIDGYPAPLYVFADTHERQDTRERSGRVGFEHDTGDLTLRAGLAYSANDRDLVDEDVGPDPYYRTHGALTRAELFGRYAPGTIQVDFGAEGEWSRFSANGAFSADRGRARTASGHAMVSYVGEALRLGAGLRYDDHSRFGGAWTLGANGAFQLSDSVRLRASYGEGFKAPTLFQLLSDYGNGALRPERSRSYDGGIEFGAREGTLHAAVSAFRRDSRNLIDFVSCFGATGGICTGRPFGTYDNVGAARASGFEVELGARPSGTLQLQAAYSYVRAKDRATGLDLARRPRHALTASVDWTTPFALVIGGDARLVSDSYDDAANATRVDGHALFDLRASVPLSERFELYGRVENLFDARYTEVAGYGTQNRAAYVGARVRL